MLLIFQNPPLPPAALKLDQRHCGSHWMSKPSALPMGPAMAGKNCCVRRIWVE